MGAVAHPHQDRPDLQPLGAGQLGGAGMRRALRAAQRLQADLRQDAYEHAQRLDMAFFESKSSGQLVATMNDDVNQLERFLDGGANALIQVGVTVVAVGAVSL